jgi:circadian clock protein KaiC
VKPSGPVRASTGIDGLDEILCGGLPRDRIYLLQGDPGVGKTTVGLQFLRAAVAAGERCLYITLSESSEEITSVAASHGWTLDGIDLFELSALEQTARLETENTLFEPSEVELHETTRLLLDHVERIKPDRVVFDSLSELRLLAQSPLRYRRQILSLKQYFVGKKTTVLLLDDRTSDPKDLQLQSIAHGVIHMEQNAPSYGEDRRRLRILKMRAVKYRGGYHDFTIRTGGMVVFPRLVAAQHRENHKSELLPSGIPGLDALLGGGLDRGTATLVIGPAGSGKSATCVQYAIAAAERGEKAALFIFDERIPTLLTRARALGADLEKHLAEGRVIIQQIDPAEMGPGEFANTVQHIVERDHVSVIVIDSLNGYLNAMPDENLLTVQMHEVLGYLGNKGVASIMVVAQHGMLGHMQSPVDLSYLSDTVLLLRYFEAAGRIRKAISVVKRRNGAHENTIRELTMDSQGIHVGAPLDEFRGVLTGVPTFVGAPGKLQDR